MAVLEKNHNEQKTLNRQFDRKFQHLGNSALLGGIRKSSRWWTTKHRNERFITNIEEGGFKFSCSRPLAIAAV
jgi:hypothetical protein